MPVGDYGSACGPGREPQGSVVVDLSMVLPAFNEEANLEQVVRRGAAYAEHRIPEYELLVVNDGSRDRTGKILDRLAPEFPRLRALHHSTNRGYGAALRTGFAAATKRFVFFMDADGQFDVRELDLLLPLATDEQHIVTGFRLERRDPFPRRVNAKLFGAWLIPLMLNVRVRDLNCAFKLIPRRVLDTIVLESTGALINAELFARAARYGFGIKEVGVHHYPRMGGSQTGARASVILRAFQELLVLRRKILSDGSSGSAGRPTPFSRT